LKSLFSFQNAINNNNNNNKMTEQSEPVYFANVYNYDGVIYDQHFPVEWAKSDSEKRLGPYSCEMCKTYGMWRGVFIGYCGVCAFSKYNYTRTCGFKGDGIPDAVFGVETAFETYLAGVTLENIGIPPPTPLCRSVNVRFSNEEPQVSYSNVFDDIVPQTTFADNVRQEREIAIDIGVETEEDEFNPMNQGFVDEQNIHPPSNFIDVSGEIQHLRSMLHHKMGLLEHYKKLWKADRDQINYLMELVSILEAELEVR